MNLGLDAKRVLVFGASTGIGYAIAEKFAEENASVTLISRSLSNLQTAQNSIARKVSQCQLQLFEMDLTNPTEFDAKIPALLEKGPFDIAVFNAGGPPPGNVLQLSTTDWERGFSLLQRNFFSLIPKLVEPMKVRKWGRLLFVTSTTANEIIPRLAVSGVFRAGLTSYVKSLAREVGREGILVNCLLPGPTRTERLRELEKKSPEFYTGMETESGLGRVAEPFEIANVAVFLCSGANTYISGTDILVDGAYTKAL